MQETFQVKTVAQRCQRTIARTAQVQGIGFLTGARVHVCFHPAPANTGIVFVRTDLRPAVSISARLENVSGTQRRTTLGQGSAQVTLVEHVLAALAGLHIDNCFVELNAGELPGLDGSAQPFVAALQAAGTLTQAEQRPIRAVEASVGVRTAGATLALHPAVEEFKISYFLDYGTSSPIGRQLHTQTVTPQEFASQLAPCRTFLLEQEAVELRRQGLGRGVAPSDLLVIGPRGPIHNTCRYGNELARHKVLDIVGDLALLGYDLRGHVVAYRSGHPLNIELARALASQTQNDKPLAA